MPGLAKQLRSSRDVAQALAMAEVEPRRVLDLLGDLCREPPPDVPVGARGLAALACGRAYRHLGRQFEAASCFELAVSLLAQGGERSAAAHACVDLARERINAGRFDEAVAVIDLAARDLSGVDRARAVAQRALARQRGGRTVDALEDWDHAIRAFSSAHMPLQAAICRESRGLVHAYRGELDEADADLAAAQKAFARSGDEIRAIEVVHNRGFVAARRGDLPRSLSLFDQAQSRAAELGVLRPGMLVDRAEAYLQAGLAAEARSTAEAAVDLLEKAGLEADVPEACLLVARACEQGAEPGPADQWAHRAAELFRAQGRPRWELLAEYAAVRAQAVPGAARHGIEKQLRSIAEQLRQAGWSRQALEAEARLIEVLVDGRHWGRARALLEASVGHLAQALPLGRLEVRLSQARYYLARSDAQAAERALRAGLGSFRSYLSTLGSLELRAAGGGQAERLLATGVEVAMAAEDPRRALWWMEAVRVAQAGARLGHRRPTTEMTAALASLREITLLEAREGLPSREAAVLRARQRALEEVVRRCSRQAAGAGRAELPVPAKELARLLGRRLLVEFAVVDRKLLAVVLHNGRCRLVELASASQFREAVALLRFALNAGIRNPDALSRAQLAAAKLDALIIQPLSASLNGEVVLVPEGLGSSVPWAALPGLADAVVVVGPSASVLLRPRPKLPLLSRPPRVTVLVGPGLAHGGEEAEAVGSAWGAPQVLSGEKAGFGAAKAVLHRSDVVHIAAHGSFKDGNALLSTVFLADGPVTAGELAEVTKQARLVVLSCCDSAMADGSGVGFTRALNETGPSTVVASVTPVSDPSSVALMGELHRQVAAGSSPASALASARRAMTEPSGVMSSLGFLCFGDGFEPLVMAPVSGAGGTHEGLHGHR